MAEVRPPRCPRHVVSAAGCPDCAAEQAWRIAQAAARLQQYLPSAP